LGEISPGMEQKKARRVSFRQKNPTKCPVCSNEFYREEMLTGGGRLIAGKITDELRRLYEKNEKWGNFLDKLREEADVEIMI